MIRVNKLNKIYRRTESTNFWQYIFNRRYKDYLAVDNISFEIEANELVGFIGPNGAGKTTTLKMLSGILHPTSGKIDILGYRPFDKKHEFLKQIGFVMGQKSQLIWDLPAIDSFKINKEIYELEDRKYQENLNDLLSRLDAVNLINQPVKTLSLGQRMKMELIAALLHHPKVLFLDEPTIGLDVLAQVAIRNFIKDYQRDHLSTIILTSHYMQDVISLAKRVILINKGKIIFDGSLNKLVTIHSQYKLITVMFDKMISLTEIKKRLPGLELEFNYPKLNLKVDKEKIGEVMSIITKEMSYYDLTIESEPLEEIVKKSFSL